MLGLLWRRLSPERVAGHVIDESAFPLAAQPRDIVLTEHRNRLPAWLTFGVVEFRWRRLLARLFLPTLFLTLCKNDLGVGVAVLSFLDLPVAILDQHR